MAGRLCLPAVHFAGVPIKIQAFFYQNYTRRLTESTANGTEILTAVGDAYVTDSVYPIPLASQTGVRAQ
jgi:hypothetical protein